MRVEDTTVALSGIKPWVTTRVPCRAPTLRSVSGVPAAPLPKRKLASDHNHFAAHRRNKRVDEGRGRHREQFRGAAEQDDELHPGGCQQGEPFGLQSEISVLTLVKYLAGVSVEGYDTWREAVSSGLGERPDQELLVPAVDPVELPDGDHRRPSRTHPLEVPGTGRMPQRSLDHRHTVWHGHFRYHRPRSRPCLPAGGHRRGRCGDR